MKIIFKKFRFYVNRGWLFLLETIFPRFCVGCDKEGKYICEKCMLFISEAGFVCPACQIASYSGKIHKKCKRPKELNGLISIWDYDGIIREVIHSIKYGKFFHILEELMERIILLIEKDETRFSYFLNFLTYEKTYITFVPIYKLKEKERGFNQSEILAGYVSKIVGKKPINLLQKTKDTKSQTGLEKKERFLNIKDAFSFNLQKNILIEKVLIVDDVWTSGATMKECCRILKENGVKEVWGFTLAKA